MDLGVFVSSNAWPPDVVTGPGLTLYLCLKEVVGVGEGPPSHVRAPTSPHPLEANLLCFLTVTPRAKEGGNEAPRPGDIRSVP